MADLDFIDIPLVNNVKESDIPSPEEYTYWKARASRTFYVDYEIDDNYDLIELEKIIIQMNMEEKDVENPKPIYLFVFSYGGSLDQAYSFCSLCIASRIPIITVNMGVSMSAGFLILLCGSRRYALKNSSALVHQGSAGFSGTADQVDSASKNYKVQLTQMKDYILNRTKIDDKTFNKNKSKDWYLTDEEQVSYGVVDKIIDNFTDIL